MKVAEKRLDMQTGGMTGETTTFNIVNNAKMFAILVDKIYADKPRAVVREISCNALDIHAQTGQTKPFLLVVPNAANPTFVVRDYGCGLSHEDVIGLYTTFGESTKEQSNDQVGAFGLGSKSPFAYCDMFTVASYQGGVKRTYTAYRDASMIPSMSMASEVETDEADGLEVMVPVKAEDIHRFSNAISQTLVHFPADSYELAGGHVHISRPTYVWESTGVAEVECSNYNAPASYVVMGPVRYEVDWSAIPSEYSEMFKRLEFRVPMGGVDLQPSREGLSMDDATIATLVGMCQELRETSKQRVDKDLEGLSGWDKKAYFNDKLQNSMLGKLAGYNYTNTEAETVWQFEESVYLYSRHAFTLKNLKPEVVSKTRAKMETIFLVLDDDTKRNMRVRQLHKDEEPMVVIACEKAPDGVDPAKVFLASEIKLPKVFRNTKKSGSFPRILRWETSNWGPAAFRQQSEATAVSLIEQGGTYVPMSGSSIDPNAMDRRLMGRNFFIPCLTELVGLSKKARAELDIDAFQPYDERVREEIERLGDIGLLLAEYEQRSATDDYEELILALRKSPNKVGDPFFDPAWELVRNERLTGNTLMGKVISDLKYLISIEFIPDPVRPKLPNWASVLERLATRRPLFAKVAEHFPIREENMPIILSSLTAKGPKA
jgi:hypothetical protein